MTDDNIESIWRKTMHSSADRAPMDFARALVAAERAWFAQVLTEWDRTEDVERVLRLRLAGPGLTA